MNIGGWIGVRQPGYCEEVQAAIKKLNRHARRLALADIFYRNGNGLCHFIPQYQVMSAVWTYNALDNGRVPAIRRYHYV